MKHYERMVELGSFSRDGLAMHLHLNDATTASVLRNYLKKGYIERVRHNSYVVISIENKQPILSRYAIGGRLFPDACVSHHSAFEVYGYANQVFYEVYVTTQSRFKDFEYDGITYHRMAPKGNVQVETYRGVSVTSIEQTVIDSIHTIDQIGGLEEFLRCLALVPFLDERKLLLALENYQIGFLYQKTGFLLEQVNDSFGLSNQFFDICKQQVPKADRYVSKANANYVYHPKWRLMGPKHINSVINKGVLDDASM
jgi:predicted transcriptional regulator of viral defense system